MGKNNFVKAIDRIVCNRRISGMKDVEFNPSVASNAVS